ncbi:hypothetical protein [Catenovulum maritimum]|uniref:DUF2846 domain-containing protein n=1 Tax=Catenovulum maritimum TaxID=1513271 RepID=A0A0J8JKI7_9ALTE|nr:hypothetical protein [Catenovulum maritimum]KMT64986.1 hypothetical protein XM47_10885 [Catenovulum maritimum]
MKIKYSLFILVFLFVGCASGPSPKYDVKKADSNLPVVVGGISVWSRGVGSGTGFDLKNEDTGEFIGYTGAKSFFLRLPPGNYTVHSIGSRQGGTGSKDTSFAFTVSDEPFQYIGTLVKSFHIGAGFDVLGRKPISKRTYGVWEPIFIGGSETRKPGEVQAPFTQVFVFDDYDKVIKDFKTQFPEFSTAKFTKNFIK